MSRRPCRVALVVPAVQALAKTDTLDDIGLKIFGVKSTLDFVELVMALEARGVKLDTVDDLMRFMDQSNVD
jgi:hypothetical protein